MIEFIDNQTIKFVQEGEEDTCSCVGKPYCQPVRFTDETQFQLKGNIVNSDPSFSDQYIGWDSWVALALELENTNVSAIGVCDATIDAIASLGSGSGYEYSIDGGAFQMSGSFTGVCEGEHLITAIDSDGHYVSKYINIIFYDCASLNDSDANDVLLIETNDILNCYANDLR